MRTIILKPFLPTAILALLGGTLGIAAAVSPWGEWLETQLGLPFLYGLRGTRPPPSDVVIVSVDPASARELGQPVKIRKWDRRLHAELVEAVTRHGAKVVVFDIFFDEPRKNDPEQDRIFRSAIREAGNVLLYADLRLVRRDELQIETLVPPLAMLADASAGFAPFVLPREPVRVDRAWLFKPSAGDWPTLPVVAFQQFASDEYPALRSLLQRADFLDAGIKLPEPDEEFDVALLTRELRELFASRRDLQGGALLDMVPSSERKGLLAALVALYGGPDSYLIDFYGPPHTIRTVSYHSVLSGDPELLASFSGKAVFVGASDKSVTNPDSFYTVYRRDGVDLSGVEIAATQFANLLEGRRIRPLARPLHLVMILLWGMGVAIAWFWFHPVLLAATIPLFSSVLLGVTWHAFSTTGLWLPTMVPLLVQMPLILISVLAWRYLYTWREREKVRVALRRLLPEPVVVAITKGLDCEVENQTLFGVCLATDASRYTELSERMEPEVLRRYLNLYYQALFQPVKREQGFVSDVVGDAMMAIWCSLTQRGLRDGDMRQKACEAALQIICQVDEFNRRHREAGLPTRIGLHCGPISLGHVGAADHYEFRAVGDTINTASRIEALNKVLGTSILASDAVVDTVEGIIFREVGSFLLKGKNRPLTLYELQCHKTLEKAILMERNQLFADGLHRFRERDWSGALKIFGSLMERFGPDGPSGFYRKLCRRCLQGEEAVERHGVIVVGERGGRM